MNRRVGRRHDGARHVLQVRKGLMVELRSEVDLLDIGERADTEDGGGSQAVRRDACRPTDAQESGRRCDGYQLVRGWNYPLEEPVLAHRMLGPPAQLFQMADDDE